MFVDCGTYKFVMADNLIMNLHCYSFWTLKITTEDWFHAQVETNEGLDIELIGTGPLYVQQYVVLFA